MLFRSCKKADQFGICPYVTAQELLQGKWAILILHELEGGPRRFNQLQKAIDVTQATLSSQLRKMEAEGLVSRTVYAEVPPRVEYQLTEIGRTFVPVLASIRSWGEQYIAYLHAKNHSENKDAVQEEKAQ